MLSAMLFQFVISARPALLAILTKVTVATVEEVLLADLLATKRAPHLFSVNINVFFSFAYHSLPFVSWLSSPTPEVAVLYRVYLPGNTLSSVKATSD
jgi:hypothetical protein